MRSKTKENSHLVFTTVSILRAYQEMTSPGSTEKFCELLCGVKTDTKQKLSPPLYSEVRKPTSPKRTKLFKGRLQLQNSKKIEDGNWEERVNNKYRAKENSEKQFYFGF